MHKNLKSEKGVTLISLVVTIVVMMILVISITSSLSTTTELKRFNEVKEDILKRLNRYGDVIEIMSEDKDYLKHKLQAFEEVKYE